MTLATIEMLENVFQTNGARALIDAACAAGTNNNLVNDLWGAAMTATFGPVGLHKSWTNTDGSPSAEALVAFPQVGRAMQESLEKIPRIFACMRRWAEAA